MGLKVADLFATLRLDSKEYEEGLSKAKKSLSETGESISKFGGKLMKSVTLPLAGAGVASFKFASDLEDAIGASEQIFGKASQDMINWANSLESYYGIAKGEALEYSNTMGAMLKNIGGLTEEEAAKQAQTLVELAGDLTAMFGGTTEDAIRALTGALKGNTSMLDNYGMGVNEATIKAKALELGLMDAGASAEELTKANINVEKAQKKYNEALKKYGKDSLEAREAENNLAIAKKKLEEASEKVSGTLSLEAKQQATLALIMEQTADAQGQAAREAEGASGSMRGLVTELKNLSTELGGVLLPIITPFIAKLKEILQSFRGLSPEAQKTIVTVAGILAVIPPIIVGVGKLVTAIGAIKKAFVAVKAFSFAPLIASVAPVMGIVAIVAGVVAGVILAIKNWDKIKPIVTKIWEGIKSVISKICGAIVKVVSTIFNGLVGILKAIFTGIATVFTTYFEIYKTIVTTVFNAIVTIITSILSGIATVIRGIWNGIVTVTTSIFGGLKNTVSTIWEGIKSAIMTPINKAVEGVRGAVEKIKGFFSKLDLKLPDIKLPHFTFSGSMNPLKWAEEGVPKIGVEWYAKGGIFDKPRVIGVGEAGSEAVVPLAGNRMRPFAQEIARLIGAGGGEAVTQNITVQVQARDLRQMSDVVQLFNSLAQSNRSR